ncbi:MAG: phosphoribosylformylglycinamidine synthase subunit PurL [Candidatus Kapabacteria bacterium]|nr:phosphoribosylformylglycinamidine synthase subunit PurL [Candidatus Kapabacteria bacterium]
MNENVYSEVPVSVETAFEVGLNEEEYSMILNILGRVPSYTELGVYGVLWSEHCSYKNSIKLIKTFPRSGGRLLVEAGAENAGLVDVGNGYAIAFKIESHNHPSAVEPYQGAATGVGGILRDIFSMGARPIASLDSLRFGELNNPRTQYLLKGVVKGIGDYGNSFGVPTVGGEVYFDDCYQDNPLINAEAVGIVHKDKIISATAKGIGNPVYILGSRTGRDGIHGASLLASREFDEKSESLRPSVQVGDPFAEKTMLEALLEMLDTGVLVGVQDMGAAGISSSTSEMSARGDVGMLIDLDKVPLRENEMSAYEIMLSESQERMLLVIEKGKDAIAQKIAQKWDVPLTQVGEVIAEENLKIYRNGKLVVDVPAKSLVLGGGAPQYDRETKRPHYLDELNNYDFNKLENKYSNEELFWKLISSPTISSKKWVYEQYDSQVLTNTVSISGDAAIIRLKEIPGKAIALSTDCNERYVYLDAYQGGLAAVCEGARNVACVGAEPIAITNCLNFGNPYDPEVYWQFTEAVRGIRDACIALNTPVTGGNVSFHNESQNNAIFPTPVIGMLGIIDNLDDKISLEFKQNSDIIYLLGNNREELGGSEVIKIITDKILGKAPMINLAEEIELQKLILDLIHNHIINAAHDVAEGGIAIALAEMSIASREYGCNVDIGKLSLGNLFGESQSRIIITLPTDKIKDFENTCKRYNVPFFKLGKVIEDKFIINNVINTDRRSLQEKWDNALESQLL